LHFVVPTLHGVVTWQVAFSLQATQVPALQTLSVPQTVPDGTLVALSTHVNIGEHIVLPL